MAGPPRQIALFADFGEKDKLFDVASSRDGSYERFALLRAGLEARGQAIHTADVYLSRGEVPDLLLCLNAPWQPVDEMFPAWRAVPRWVDLAETEVVLPHNWEPEVMAQFSRLFTWRDAWVDGQRIFKLPFTHVITLLEPLPEPDRFCVMIAGNKLSPHPLELYRARRQVIRWFERNHPAEFDLYGTEWDLLVVEGPKIVRALHLLPRPLRRLLAPSFPSYRGSVPSKLDVLSRYRFSICYENARDIEGYVTEKIFDCLCAGTIPVYWGAPDITDHVPAECFIDRRDYGSLEELYDYLASLPASARGDYRAAGQAFLRSDRMKAMSSQAWVEVLLDHLGRPLKP